VISLTMLRVVWTAAAHSQDFGERAVRAEAHSLCRAKTLRVD
jgi:hypothetical protein